MTTTTATIRVGDYYANSWGYDQTNIDYIIVVGISPTGKTVLCRRANALQLSDEGTSIGVTPGVSDGPTFRLHVRERGLVGQYPFIWGWWTERRLGYFSPIRFGDVLYETKPEFGH